MQTQSHSRPYSPPDVAAMRQELAQLSRKDLQTLAKQEGIRANGRSADIIEALLLAAWEDAGPHIPDMPAKQASCKEPTAPLPDSSSSTSNTAASNSGLPADAASTAAPTAPAARDNTCRATSSSGRGSTRAADVRTAVIRDQTEGAGPSRTTTTAQMQTQRPSNRLHGNAGPGQAGLAAAHSSTAGSAIVSRGSSGGGSRARHTSAQEAGAAAVQEHLQPKMQQLSLSLHNGPKQPAAAQQASTLAAARPAAAAGSALASSRSASRAPGAQQQQQQQQQLARRAGVMPCSSRSPVKAGVVPCSSKSPAQPGIMPAKQDHQRRKRLAPAAASRAVPATKQPTAAPVAAPPLPAAVITAQQQQQQRGLGEPPQTPGGLMLHTPMRVRVKDSSNAAAAPAAARGAGTGSIAAARPGAVTPPRQQVKAFGESMPATPTMKAPGGMTAAAAAAGGAGTAAAAAPNGLLSPRLAVMGSARRVVPTHSRVGPAAAAGTAAPGNPSAAGGAGIAAITVIGGAGRTAVPAATVSALSGPAAAAAGTASAASATPLLKPARRLVPPEAEQSVGEEERQLEVLVERCLRISNPDAPQSVLHGSDPAKRWLQQHIIAPLKRAAPAPAAARSITGSSSSSSSSSCMAAGFCHKALLLYGPSGSGKTEVVHALAREMGANLLYVPAGDLLKSCQDQGQKLLRALMKVARRVAPTVVCFDDAHRSFPADARLSNPNHALHKMLVELRVQLQQLADMQAQLEQQLQRGGSSGGGSSGGGSGGAGGGAGGVLMSPAKAQKQRPVWGAFGGKQKQHEGQGLAEQQQPKQQPSQQSFSALQGPVVVVFATRHPEALEPALLGLLPVRLLLDLPCADAREELLLAWLMEKEAAVGVQDVEKLARATEGFSCSDLLQLCHEAAMRPVQERARRAVCMRDFEAAFLKVAPSVTPQRRAQLKSWV